MTKLTENELAMLRGFRAHGGAIYSQDVHSYCRSIDKQAVGGVSASLVKKGFLITGIEGDDTFLELAPSVKVSYSGGVLEPGEPHFYLERSPI